MKITFLFIAVLTTALVSAQTFTKSPTISIDADYGFYHPQIEMTGDDKACLLWTSSDSLDLYFAKHNGVDDFNTPLKLNPDGLDVQDFVWSGADFAVEGTNIYAVFKQAGYSTGGIYLVKSTDNGDSFGDTVRVDDLAVGYGQYPDVAVLNDTVWVTFMDHNASGGDPQYVVARSTDGGLSFEPEVIAGAILPGEACDCCQPEIMVDANRVVLVLRNNNSNVRDIKAVVSTDRGATFSNSFSLDDHNWVINYCPSTGPDARLIGSDKIMAIYKSTVLSNAAIFVHEYDMGAGSSNGEVQVLVNGTTNALMNYPQLDYEASESMLGFVWEQAGDATDVYINASSTGLNGISASNAMNITNEPGTQNKPDIIIRNGVFHVVYADYNEQNLKYLQLTSNFAHLNKAANTFGMNVYPTPSKDFVTIEFDQLEGTNSSLQVFTILGQLVLTKSGQSSYTISKNELPAGEYIFKLSQGESINQGQFQFVD